MSNSWTTLRDVQKVQLEILLEFDRICRKHGLKYLLFAGTLLGAVRHKGFIPWDDDIDVCMLRGDYERFLTVCKDELSAELFLQTTDTDR
jgi:lipopolysaccharide cholinephosphotransferase